MDPAGNTYQKSQNLIYPFGCDGFLNAIKKKTFSMIAPEHLDTVTPNPRPFNLNCNSEYVCQKAA